VATNRYIKRLQGVIAELHGCDSKHVESVPVREVVTGKTLWEGEVEVFDLIGHPKAKRCYSWSYGEPERFIIILELPPVTDAPSAVKVGASYQIKQARDE
jgi:hypothetical protein